jgi:hypothetical protein
MAKTMKINLEETMAYLTPDELTVTRAAVRASLDLRQRYVKLVPEDTKMKRKRTRILKEIPLLKSALGKLNDK